MEEWHLPVAEEERNGEFVLSLDFQFYKMKRVLKMGRDGSCKTVNIFNTTGLTLRNS